MTHLLVIYAYVYLYIYIYTYNCNHRLFAIFVIFSLADIVVVATSFQYVSLKPSNPMFDALKPGSDFLDVLELEPEAGRER